MIDTHHFDTSHLETYILGRLTDAQCAMMREAFRQDPDLLFEYKWQLDLIHCLQHYRKRELKQRLQVAVWQ